ncbi:MAG: AAA family ATPase [Actinomycetota bacterium]|nr:AAA family ATPase [Actinomycetota bacterium]
MRSSPGHGLIGRRDECAALDAMLAAVHKGHSAALVLRGEAGVGKTALLEYMVGRAAGCEIARASGVESEMELAYAGLHQLCAPFLEHLDQLPGPQRDALSTAFGLRDGDAPDRFLVGLATLTLLANAAEQKSLVCIVDDAQWLDRISAQTLAFVARRLLAESIAIVFAVRDPATVEYLAGLDELEVHGLDDEDAHALLTSAIYGPVDPEVRERIIAETRGNPLALLLLPRGRTPAELAFGFEAPRMMSVATRIERDYLRRLEQLSPQTRQLLLLTAAEPVGDTALLRRAADLLGLAVDATPAKNAGLVEFGMGVRFRHPLVRSAVYRSAAAEDRREVHAALAAATDRRTEPDRRAWHAAQACAGVDETVARELELSADRAQRRGGLAAAGVMLQRAAELTPDPGRRGGRALAAAEAEFAAAAPESALELLAMAKMCPLDELQQASLARLEARIRFARTRGSDAAALLLQAATRLEAVDETLARETYLEAISAAVVAGRLSGPAGAREIALAALRAPAARTAAPASLLLDGVAAALTDVQAEGIAALRRALASYAEEPLTNREATMNWLMAAFIAHSACIHLLWDFDAWETMAVRGVQQAREIGALSVLPYALMSLAGVRLHAGDLSGAATLIDEGNAITVSTRNAPVRYAALNLVAWRGDEDAALELLDGTVQDATERGETYVLALAGYVTAVLYNGLGRYDLALTGARRASEHDGFPYVGWALPERVEAAVRSGAFDEAHAARSMLEERTHASGTDWALGIQARSDALLTEGATADRLYQEAIERLGRSGVAVQEARAHLLYGEWLRREKRRREARDHLRTAYEMLSPIGVDAFAERAQRELRATGGTVRKRAAAQAREGLTAQESQIAQLAASGLTNPEIGAQLFLSAHTVEWHLRKVFAALDITSRRQLSGVLPEAGIKVGSS